MEILTTEPCEGDLPKDHIKKLLAHCRVCSKPTGHVPGRNVIPVSNYKGTIAFHFKYDLDNDIQGVHPPFICLSCDRMLDRVRKARNRRKKVSTRITELFHFEPHSGNCSVCDWEKQKTPRDTPEGTSPTRLESEAATPPGGKKLKLSSTASHDQGALQTENTASEIEVKYDRCVEKHIAARVKCVYCECISRNKRCCMTSCKHILCFTCVRGLLDNGSACPLCKSVIEDDDLWDATHTVSIVTEEMHVKCRYVEKGCEEELKLDKLLEHEKVCIYGRYSKAILAKPKERISRPRETKMNLNHANPGYVKRKRLKTLIQNVRSYCTEHYENLVDVLFFMLKNELKLQDETELTSKLQNMWDSMESKNVSAKEDILKHKHDTVIPSPDELTEVEAELVPSACEYSLTDSEEEMTFEHNFVKDTSLLM